MSAAMLGFAAMNTCSTTTYTADGNMSDLEVNPEVFYKEAGTTSVIIKGKASWYSQNDPGVCLTTANMERFDDSRLTCAMRDLPFNTILKVTNLENGKFVFVRVNDRGPDRKLNRAIDLSKAAFARICDLEKGLADVSVEITLTHLLYLCTIDFISPFQYSMSRF